MILEVHHNLRRPQRLEATRLVVRHPLSNLPVALVLEAPPGVITVYQAGDHGFEDVLRIMGIHQTVLVETAVVGPPPVIRF